MVDGGRKFIVLLREFLAGVGIIRFFWGKDVCVESRRFFWFLGRLDGSFFRGLVVFWSLVYMFCLLVFVFFIG